MPRRIKENLRLLTAPLVAIIVVGFVGMKAQAAQPSCTIIADVTVVATDRLGTYNKQDVVIRGSKIAAVLPHKPRTRNTRCARIDGSQRFLIPGLVDSHVHLFGYRRGGEGDSQTELAILQMLLANGITTAVIMEGSPAVLRLKSRITAGIVVGPRLFSAGPLIQGPGTGELPLRRTFLTPEDVRVEVESEKKAGYDFVKVHGAMQADTYAMLLQTARLHNLPVIGHVPDNLGLDVVLNGGQKMISHAESYLQGYFEFHRDLPTDPQEIAAMVADASRRSARSGIFVQPTLSVFRQIIDQVGDPEAWFDRPEMQLLPAVSIREWQADMNPYLIHWSGKDLPRFRAQYSIMQQLVRGLRDAGVPLLVGTDPMVPLQLPGFAMRDEMVQMQEAGLTPFEVLQAATYTSARFLGRGRSTGQVHAGFDADLVLLSANPLDDISNVFRQDGIFLRGKFLPDAKLQRAIWHGPHWRP